MYYRILFRSVKNYKINLVIKILIISDFMIWSSYQLLAPIFAIFITDRIAHGTIEAVGIAAAAYFLTKSLCEIPIGLYIDKHPGEKDDLYLSMIGTIMMALTFFTYIFINQVWQLYLLQVLLGLAAAIAFPGWYSIFTRHIDKDKAALEWSVYDVLIGIGMALAAALGGFIADHLGFDWLFIIVSLLTFIGALLLLTIKKHIYNQ